MDTYHWLSEEGQDLFGQDDKCPVCWESSWDGSELFLAEDGLLVHDRCVGRSLIYSMEKLRFQARQLGMVIAKETGLIALVEWLERKLR